MVSKPCSQALLCYALSIVGCTAPISLQGRLVEAAGAAAGASRAVRSAAAKFDKVHQQEASR